MGHDISQLTKVLGLGAESVGDHGLVSVGQSYQLLCLRAGVVIG